VDDALYTTSQKSNFTTKKIHAEFALNPVHIALQCIFGNHLANLRVMHLRNIIKKTRAAVV
jgi:hypothetical protein